uniref:NADH-ubiquinone oxidoreductase chain 5 n=1 Tax=Derodontidae sp. BMNH 899913 TaxID=1903806 RepID=A0A343A4G4_9COLE|nr:NADH dehydrogenase subunit 5 [Derodontidae sp. BMNH 899913]
MSMIFFFLGLMFLIKDQIYFLEYSLFMINSSIVSLILLIDWMSLLFMSFVLFISGMVINYSEEYMSSEKNLIRFILIVLMFVLSMMMMILSPNLISILLGWDGLGLVSYCLVIYYQNIKSYNAGMITALSNRIGDVALLISIAWMLNYGSWNLIFYIFEYKSSDEMNLISMLLVLAAMTKSAQMPFSSWLPAAMAAPTPVSSLVHSSTLVTAGVYLMIRFNFCLNISLMYMILFISSMTMFMSGLSASFEFDLKKIIALSTLSQLGLMFSILMMGNYNLAFFHLLTHALFKALLFLCAGLIIHNLNNCQDIRYMGSLINFMPLTLTIFMISNLSLCGLPFLSGFYSKDLILEFMCMNYFNLYIYLVFYISIGLTVCYSFRLLYYLTLGSFNFNSMNLIIESYSNMLKSMLSLLILVVFMGSVLNWLMFNFPYLIVLSFSMKLMTLFLIFLGIYFGLEISKFKLNYVNIYMNFYKFSWFNSMMWNLPNFSTFSVNLIPLNLSNFYLKNLDQGWFEFYGKFKLMNLFKSSSMLFQFLFMNSMKLFFLMFFLILMLILIL